MTQPLQLVSVNVGRAIPRLMHGRRILTAIGKQPVGGPVAVAALGLAGDEQADLSVHGGLDKAVYAFAVEHLPAWQQMRHQALVAHHTSNAGVRADLDICGGVAELDTNADDGASIRHLKHDAPLPPGFVGENLSLRGLLEHEVWVGDLLVFADCVLRVTAPRQPCDKFNAVMGYARAAKDMVQSARCGFYLAVQQPGSVQAGETFRLQPGARALRIDHAIRAKAAKVARD